MRKIQNGVSLSAAEYCVPWLAMGIGFTLMPCAAYVLLLTADYSSVPPYVLWILIPIISIIVIGMGYFLINGLGMLLFCVERIEITEEELRMKLGFITTKRIPTQLVLTVGYTEQGFEIQKAFSKTPMLVISTLPPDKIIEAGQKRLSRKQALQKDIRTLTDEQKCVYAYYVNKTPQFMLGFGKEIVLEFSEKRLEIIKQYISDAKYVI